MRYILTLAILLSNLNLFSQASDDIGKICLHVVLPEEYSPNFENLGIKELKKIKSKITSIASRNGVAGAGMGDFVIYPVLNIYDEEVVEGLDRQTIIRGEFSLFIQQMSNGQIYGEATIPIEGFGRDRSRALTKCIQGINIRDRQWKEMITSSKEKIIEYYTSRCEDIKAEADGYSQTRDYVGAIAILMQVPVEVSCYREIVDKSVEFYDYYIEMQCQEQISKAKIAKTQDNWDEAAGYLLGVLPDYKCYNDAMILLKEIEDHRCAIYLSKANAAWAKGEAGANEAAHWLGLIPSDSKCSSEASQLSADIRSRLTELDKREWDLQYEKYNREIQLREQRQASELYLKEEKQDREFSLREQRQGSDIALRENQQSHDQSMDNKEFTLKGDKQVHDQSMDNKEFKLKGDKQAHDQSMQKDKLERDYKLANREMDYKQGRGADLKENKQNNMKEIAIARIKADRKKAEAKAKAKGETVNNYNYYSKKKKK
jgi:hypothetical protein